MSDEIARRLTKCFQIVFPTLPEADIPSVTHASVPEWDSMAGVRLVSVIEEEFPVSLDFEQLAEMDSFARIADWLQSACRESGMHTN